MSGQRLNTTLDGEHAPKLADLAARVHGNEGTLARSLLSSAIDGRDPDPANVADLDRLVRTQSLPSDTRKRFRTSLEPLRRFPRLGPEPTGRWEGFWSLVGPGTGCC
ncbi:MAG: type II toxin-antitoxin system RelE family toxin, partial [Nitriliruptoraceae bacterium]